MNTANLNTTSNNLKQEQTIIKIPFFDADPMRVVWHGNYIKYMEIARNEFLEKRNLGYAQIDELGVVFPVITMQAKYIRPCVVSQEIIVTTTLVESDNCLIFKYEFHDKNSKQRLFKGETRQMVLDMQTHESYYEIPSEILKRLKEI